MAIVLANKTDEQLVVLLDELNFTYDRFLQMLTEKEPFSKEQEHIIQQKGFDGMLDK